MLESPIFGLSKATVKGAARRSKQVPVSEVLQLRLLLCLDCFPSPFFDFASVQVTQPVRYAPQFTCACPDRLGIAE